MIGVAAGDFNGDGITDLALVSNYNYVAVLLGHGDGTFSVSAAPAPGNYPLNVVVADFNGDGGPDLAITQANGTTAAIMLNQAVPADNTLAVSVPGGGTHQLQATFTPSSTWYTSSVSNLVAVSGAQIATNTTVTASPGFAAPAKRFSSRLACHPHRLTITRSPGRFRSTTEQPWPAQLRSLIALGRSARALPPPAHISSRPSTAVIRISQRAPRLRR
jgi:hypothetical protein